MKDFKYYVEAFSHLNTAKVKGLKAPHKAVLLLAIIDLVESNEIRFPQIVLTDELVKRFQEVWQRYLGRSAVFTPDIAKPFFHMQHEPFWKLVDWHEAETMMAAEQGPWRKDAADRKELPKGSYSVAAMRTAFAYAVVDDGLLAVLQNEDARAMLRVVLINEYLANQPTKTMPNLAQLMMALPMIALVA